ncbi:hypothetical protein BdWA1_003440 [Babesia duncani]|uniref:Uncharacterized protein n=1 Tax=Babesia duncani TaxID=323732 RepID=A0AAD9PI17_9APIC|nr:hypothetical protein BdWA1_003440 [Babesia duncani]
MVACYVYVAIYWLSILYPVNCIFATFEDDQEAGIFNPGVVDICIFMSTEHVSRSGGKLGAMAAVIVFAPLGISGFNIVKEGEDIIWHSNTSQTRYVMFYRTSDVRLLAFSVKNKDNDITTWNFYKKDWGGEWKPTDYKEIIKHRLNGFSSINVDLGNTATEKYITIRNNSSKDYIRKVFKIHPEALVMEILDLDDFLIFKCVNLFEQCREIQLYGFTNSLTCKVIIDIPGGQYEIYYKQERSGMWYRYSKPLSEDLRKLVMAPIPGETTKTLHERVFDDGGVAPLANYNVISNYPGGDEYIGISNPRPVDISILNDTEHAQVLGGYLGQYATAFVYTPKDMSGFNIIKEGNYIIWNSNTDGRTPVTHYRTTNIQLLECKTEVKHDNEIKTICFRKRPSRRWKQIDCSEYTELTREGYHVIDELNLDNCTSNKYLNVIDYTTGDYVDKRIEINDNVIIKKAWYEKIFKLYKRGDVMEQCRLILIRGPPNRLHCKIIIDTPGGQYELDFIQVPAGKWKQVCRPQPEDLKKSTASPLSSDASKSTQNSISIRRSGLPLLKFKPVRCSSIDNYRMKIPFNPGTVDILILNNTKRVLVSGGDFGAFSKAYEFTAKGISGFNIIKEGDEIIWNSKNTQTKGIIYYRTDKIQLVKFDNAENENGMTKEYYYKKVPGMQWKLTNPFDYRKLRLADYETLNKIDINSATTNSHVTVTDNSTEFYVDKVIKINPAVLLWTVVDADTLELYHDKAVMEQCKLIVVRGPRENAECKITIATPKGKYELYFQQMPTTVWKAAPQPLTNYYHELIIAANTPPAVISEEALHSPTPSQLRKCDS